MNIKLRFPAQNRCGNDKNGEFCNYLHILGFQFMYGVRYRRSQVFRKC